MEKGKLPAIANIMADQAIGKAKLFRTSEGVAYANVILGDHRECLAVRRKSFRLWLTREYYLLKAEAPNAGELQRALSLIEARALFDGPVHDVFLRVAEHQGRAYIDLCNDRRQAVEIDAGGWRVVDEPPVFFRRAPGMLPLPVPVPGGTIRELRSALNVGSEDSFVLTVAWMLGALRASGPYPVLNLIGEQGTAKTTFARLVRSLIDPHTVPTRTLPRDERELSIAANNSHVASFDNLSAMPNWLSDALSRLATGGGQTMRTLYTDRDEELFAACRPIILNGIANAVERPDLGDRTLALTLKPIPEDSRLTEDEVWRRFDPKRPHILGALLDAMSIGLARLPQIDRPHLPRMADFALWIIACEDALWPSGSFLQAFRENQKSQTSELMEGDSVACALITWSKRVSEWTGNASALLAELDEIAGEGVTNSRVAQWPKTARSFATRLRRIAPLIRTIGIDVRFPEVSDGKRQYTIKVQKPKARMQNIA